MARNRGQSLSDRVIPEIGYGVLLFTGADLFAIGENRKAAVIELKASQSSRFVTSLYQKYKSEDTKAPDFWVLYSVKPTDTGFAERFFVLSHRELARIQGEVNCPGEKLSHEQIAARVSRGVDNQLTPKAESDRSRLSVLNPKILGVCDDSGIAARVPVPNRTVPGSF